MQFETPLIEATLISRYKRFLADVRLKDGSELTIHCPNPGSMMGLREPGGKVWISDSNNAKRKLRFTLELVEVDGVMVGVNTNLANRLAREAIETGLVPNLSGNARLEPEQRYGENSRIDFLVRGEDSVDIYIEVKSVTLSRGANLAEFPDSVSTRGSKHLGELTKVIAADHRAILLYVIQRDDCGKLITASDIDPTYAAAFESAVDCGLEVHAIRCAVSEKGIRPYAAFPIQS